MFRIKLDKFKESRAEILENFEVLAKSFPYFLRFGHQLSRKMGWNSTDGASSSSSQKVILVLLHVELRVGDEHALALVPLEPHELRQVVVVRRHLGRNWIGGISNLK